MAGRDQSLGSVVKKILKGLKKKGRYSEEEIARIWKEAVGKRAASHSRPVSLKGGRLVVNVDASSWLYELTVQKRDLVVRLGGELKGKKLRDIRFRIGEVTKKDARDEGKTKNG